MATPNQQLIEDMAVAKNDISTIKEDIREIKKLLKEQDGKYITRAELRVTQAVAGLVVAVITVWFMLSDHLKLK